MKHNLRITTIILAMFILTQFIGLYVVDTYSTQKVIDGNITQINATKQIPYGMGVDLETPEEYNTTFTSIFFSFLIAFLIIYALTHLKAKRVMKGWFFVVTVLALGIALTAILPKFNHVAIASLIIAIPVAFSKVFRQGILSHNLSELLIYPGIAAIFVPILNLKWTIVLLVLISLYDAWAVWKSKIMLKMAKFQMEELNVLGGFMIPYADKKERAKIKKIKEQLKAKKITEEQAAKKKVKVKMAILGGGDIVFPIITSGVVLKTWGVLPAIGIIAGALLGLSYLLFFGKKKAYPAMPYISAGIFLAMGITYFLM